MVPAESMPYLVRAGALTAQALGTAPAPPWDLDALQVLRTPHDEAQVVCRWGQDTVIVWEGVTYYGLTAVFNHPRGDPRPEVIASMALIGTYGGTPALIGVILLTVPVSTSPQAPTVAVPGSVITYNPRV